MSRARKPAPPGAAKHAASKEAASKRVATKHPRPWLLPLIAAAFVLGAAGVWWFTEHSAPKPHPKDLELSKRAANQAARFLQLKQFRQAQAAYREAVAYAPEDFWQLHFVLASTSAQISVENTTRAGISQPYSRSSVERVASMREALREFDIAAQLADTPQALATVYANRAETHFTWGQMWEAARYFEAAAQTDTSDHSLGERAARLGSLMAHPENVKTLEEEMQRARATAR